MFGVVEIPDKGKGLVATYDILKGSRILCEQPLLTCPNISPIGAMESTVAAKLRSLPKDEQRQFLSLHNNFPGSIPSAGLSRQTLYLAVLMPGLEESIRRPASSITTVFQTRTIIGTMTPSAKQYTLYVVSDQAKRSLSHMRRVVPSRLDVRI